MKKHLKKALLDKKEAIVDQWQELTFNTYPQDSVNFFRQTKNQIANPVGTTISQGLKGIVEEIFHDGDSEKIDKILSDIVKIRSVQTFTPSTALGFINELKGIVRSILVESSQISELVDYLYEFDLIIDRMMQTAFDQYVASVRLMYDIRLKEGQRSHAKLLDRFQHTENRKKDQDDHQS